MSAVFTDLYAATYDRVYAGKDYVRETDAVLRILAEFARVKVDRVLDIGCGTGRHAALLAQRGFDVTGVDRSEHMLAQGRLRAQQQQLAGTLLFRQSDVCSLDLGTTFDAALMMFNVIGYLATNDNLMAALHGIRRHLRDHALLVFDMWYGPAVMADPPGERRQEYDSDDGKIVRLATGTLDSQQQRCEISIELQRHAGENVADSSKELHQVRYFFPLEIDLALRSADFRMVAIRQFPDIDKAPDLAEWGAVVIAEAVPSSARSTR